MKKVIELIRVSTESQANDDRASIPAQRAVNRKTARAYDLEIVESVEMADVSGTAVLLAPEMQRMLKLMENPEIHGVVAREFSRLMRPENYADYAILQIFADTRTQLYLPEGPMDLSTKTGRLMGTIRAAMAGHERSEILERISSAKEEMRRSGKFPNGANCLPYGVRYDKKTGWAYEDEARPKIRRVFEKFLAGETNYNALSSILGVSRGTAKNILSNPIYNGWYVVDRKRDLSPAGKRAGKNGRQTDRRKMLRAPEDVIRVRVIDEPLISDADFLKVQRIVARKKTVNVRLQKKVGHFIYNGFLRCSKCGERLHTFRNQFDGYYYICSNKKRKNPERPEECLCPDTSYMNRDRLETLLDDLVSRTLRDPKVMRRVYEENVRAEEAASAKNDTALLNRSAEALKAKRKRVIDLFIEGVLPKADRDERLAAIDRDLALTSEEIATEAKPPAFDPEALARIFAPFAGWEFLTREEKRRMLAAISPTFSVADYEVREMYLGVAEADVEPGLSDISPDSRWKMARSASPAPQCR